MFDRLDRKLADGPGLLLGIIYNILLILCMEEVIGRNPSGKYEELIYRNTSR